MENTEDKKPKNPLAFPATNEQCNSANSESGMTLRDYFAAKAIAITPFNYHHLDAIAKHAYGLADAMLKAREI